MADKIAIMGAGALGSYVGAYLTQAGEDITFIDMWPEHVETMRSRVCGPAAARAILRCR